MSKESDREKGGISRRTFIGSSAAAGAASILPKAGEAAPQGAPGGVTQSMPPTPQQMAREVGDARPPETFRAAVRPGSDLIVQVLRDLEIEFVASNPGSSFEGLQESIINYGEIFPTSCRSSYLRFTKNLLSIWRMAMPRQRASRFAH
jgi:hypothetical protein